MSGQGRIYYRGLAIDRAAEDRKNSNWLRTQWQHSECRILLLHDNRNLMVWDRNGDTVPVVKSHRLDEVRTVLPDFERIVFLGLDENNPFFAADVSMISEAEILDLPGDHQLVDLREAGWLLSSQEAALLAYARGLLYWNRHNGYCSNCGHSTRSEQGGHVRVCTNMDCSRMHFPRTDPAVIVLVEDISDPHNPRCLLGRNARFPERLVSTLAGFVDPLESLEECVQREVFEEAGIRVDRVTYRASQPWPFPASIMLGFQARALTTEIQVDGQEIAEAHWFTPAEMQTFGEWGDGGDNYCLPRRDSIARYLIESWMHRAAEKSQSTSF